jgi:uncharacterized protein
MSGPVHSPSSNRIVTIDAIRGFALLGIVAVHMVEQYLGSPPPASKASQELWVVDAVALGLVSLLFVGKFFAMFSLLFGVSFFIQMDRAASRGQAFEGRFTWRLAVLFAIGMAHHLVYRGDILAPYAVTGLVLLVYYRVSDRWLLATAIAVLVGTPRLVLAIWAATTGSGANLSVGDDATLQAYWDTLKTGSMSDVAWLNLHEGIWPKLQFLFGWFGRGYQTLGLFLLGLYLGRHRWHEEIDARRPAIRRLMWWSIAAGVGAVAGGGAMFGAAYAMGLMPQASGPGGAGAPAAMPPLWLVVAGFTCYDVFNLGVMGAMLCGFLRLYWRAGLHRALCWFAPVGRTALSNYVAQSLVGAFIYYGYGLGLLGEVGAAAGLGLAAVIFAGQIAASAVWLRYFRYGPLEWLWRSATYLRLQRMAKGSAPALSEPA